MKDRLEPPEFVQSPESLEILEGATAAFTCTARGKPLPAVIWSKDEKRLSKNKHIAITNKDNKANLMVDSDLVIKDALIDSHDGAYVVEASSDAGNVLHEITLTGMGLA